MQYYVMKTGMAHFDVCRAYGLGLVLDVLGVEETSRAVKVRDFGAYYSVEGPKISRVNVGKLMRLFDESLAWNRVFQTAPGRGKQFSKVKKILVKGTKKILRAYQKFTIVEFSEKGETLYQSMDLSATKGYRVPIRMGTGYTEGSSIKVPAEHWALGALGEAHFTVWKRGENLVFIVPKPEEIFIRDWREIQKYFSTKRISHVSALTMLAHYSLLLIQQIGKRKKSGHFVSKFSSLIYGAMTRTGMQWKPAGGGVFPLHFLYRILESDLDTSTETFEIWDRLFKIGDYKGCENLALSLGEFLAYPRMESLERHTKIHLRYSLDKKLRQKGIFIPKYHTKCIEEVMKNAR